MVKKQPARPASPTRAKKKPAAPVATVAAATDPPVYTPAGPSESDARQTREALRRAAYACFRDLGYHEASVDTICRSAGASKGSFYYHYASKQDCFIDILESWTREVISEVQKQFEEATLARVPFAALQTAFHREKLRGRQIVPLWLGCVVLARREPAIRDVLARFFHRARLAIAEMLRPFVGPMVALDEVDGLAGSILGVFIGIVTQELVDPGKADANKASDSTLAVLGRLAQGEPTRRSVTADGKRRGRPTRMAGRRVSDQDFEQFVAPHSGTVRQTTAELRELILALTPHADERVAPRNGTLAYELAGNFLALKPQRAHVDLIFERGAELADPERLLAGAGPRVRTAKVKTEDFDRAPLSELVRLAGDLQLGEPPSP